MNIVICYVRAPIVLAARVFERAPQIKGGVSDGGSAGQENGLATAFDKADDGL